MSRRVPTPLRQPSATPSQRRTDLDKCSVGVVVRDDNRVQPGYTLISAGRETYLIDEAGRVVHEWRSTSQVSVAYLLPNGHLLRDGSDDDGAHMTGLGGDAGCIEEVTWENEVVWRFSKMPADTHLTHHDLEPMPNGNVLALCWRRVPSGDVPGRKPDLMPDGEVWDNIVIEIQPNGMGGADEVWRWSFFDHLLQVHRTEGTPGSTPRDNPHLMHVNFCPQGGLHGVRNRNTLFPDCKKRCRNMRHTATTAYEDTPGKTGEKDWLHCNSVSYCPSRNHILININVLSEMVIIDKGAPDDGMFQGFRWRWGNPASYDCGTRVDQKLFAPHYANFIEEGLPGAGNVLVFNNGRGPDRLWSTVDEITPTESEPFSGIYTRSIGQAFGPEEPCWSYGPRLGRKDSFFCSYLSSAHRLPNGNTLICQGPQGIVFEITSEGDEVWRYINPVCNDLGTVSVTRQGDSRTEGSYSLCLARKYAPGFEAFVGRDLVPLRYLEG
mmetsp:Transcript_25606/g.64548  ORF Transcript_25606/g.64548 Transcript_25606/m.64548 type:complete len:494 (+) Transcript_25606:98-1579(+)|eukprot:CAMPEP_0173430652 /NCGR_PEP_ID=MMETSP1357-20121228/9021_1 /TAXON_ID=77926 /ORGANISM="Hemiselmis rufescens, Strain PCC563" /LENGTH=493 /DNA_ID=CAMNT_0014395029 /DNA_START=38 /DNA_END=1519 /DNA_ORIENTATION=-